MIVVVFKYYLLPNLYEYTELRLKRIITTDMTRISFNMKQTQLFALLSTETRDQGSENNSSTLFQFKGTKE
jgi:hypothetical protein